MSGYYYYSYSDLENFQRTFPKRCAKKTRSGIPCEYYTVPRTVITSPSGHTGYFYKYDINPAGKLIRVGLRLPQYNKNGVTFTEEFQTFDGKYSDIALKQLHRDFCDINLSFENLKHKYPLGKNASTDAYNVLLPWAQKNNIFPEYPSVIHYLWFISLDYKDTALTFCLNAADLTLFDIVLGNNFSDLIHKLQKIRDIDSKLEICLSSDLQLYNLLYAAFPTATFIMDVLQIPMAMKKYSPCFMDDNLKNMWINRKESILSLLDILYSDDYDSEFIQLCLENIEFFHTYDDDATVKRKISSIQDGISTILQDHPHFISDYFKSNIFDSYVPYDLLLSLNMFSKQHGFEAKRLVYLLLSEVHEISSIIELSNDIPRKYFSINMFEINEVDWDEIAEFLPPQQPLEQLVQFLKL